MPLTGTDMLRRQVPVVLYCVGEAHKLGRFLVLVMFWRSVGRRDR